MLALILLAAPPLAALTTAASQPGTATGPGIDRPSTGPRSVSGPVAVPAALRSQACACLQRVYAPPAKSAALGRYRGHTADEWAGRFRRRTRQLQNARRVLFHSPQVVEAVNLSCVVYGHCQTLWSLAQCESQLDPHARNLASSATGLFQILHPSTWRTTPYARFDVYSPYANALAAGYMVSHGRRGEWVC